MAGSLGWRMREEIEAQPRLLAENVERYAAEAAAMPRPSMIVAFARGSSDNAALYLRYLAEIDLGVPVVLGAPSVWTVFGGEVEYPPALVVGISQSGAGPDVVEAVGALGRRGHPTLAITNDAESPLARAAERAVALDVGPERAVAATKTYSATLAVLHQTVATWAALPTLRPGDFDPAWWERCREQAEAAAEAVDRAKIVIVLGRGFSYATAHETALKLMECALVPAKAYSRADFEHGPKALLGPDTAVVVFGEVPASVRESQATAVVAPAYGAPAAAPIFEVAFGQWLALEVARRRGLDADAPRGLSKVTRTR